MSLCPEAEARAEMSDAEFWEHVFAWMDPGDHFRAYDPDLFAIDCARCGQMVDVDPDEAGERERDAFCDDCASEHLPYGVES